MEFHNEPWQQFKPLIYWGLRMGQNIGDLVDLYMYVGHLNGVYSYKHKMTRKYLKIAVSTATGRCVAI